MDAMPVTTAPDDHMIHDEATLEALYGEASPGAIAKEIDFVHPHYAAMIAASPFVVPGSSMSWTRTRC
jgi:predicted pyridoxine 5'-phosphate oxidase superfamily flavin-nucleotide-binding protein